MVSIPTEFLFLSILSDINHQMKTCKLTTEEIENRSDVKVSSVSVGVSSDMSKMATSAVGAALSALGNMSESELS